MKKFILVIAILFVSFNLQAKDITVTAEGVGDGYDWAVMNAVENAVRQSSEIFVHRQSPMSKLEVKGASKEAYDENVKLKIDDGSIIGGKENIDLKAEGKADSQENATFEEKTVDAHYEGKVESYKVISSEQKDGKYHVKIEAIVKKAEEYKSPELVQKAKYSLSILPFKSYATMKCGEGKFDNNEFSDKLSLSLTNRIAETHKFNLVSRRDLNEYADEMSLEVFDLVKPEEKNRLRNLKAADYLLVGSIDYLKIGKSTTNVEMTGESYTKSSGRLQISYRLIETATMEIIATGMVEEKYKKESGGGNCSKIASNMLGDAADAMVDKIMAEVFPDYEPQFNKKEERKAKAAAKAKKVAPKKRQVVKLPFDK